MVTSSWVQTAIFPRSSYRTFLFGQCPPNVNQWNLRIPCFRFQKYMQPYTFAVGVKSEFRRQYVVFNTFSSDWILLLLETRGLAASSLPLQSWANGILIGRWPEAVIRPAELAARLPRKTTIVEYQHDSCGAPFYAVGTCCGTSIDGSRLFEKRPLKCREWCRDCRDRSSGAVRIQAPYLPVNRQ